MQGTPVLATHSKCNTFRCVYLAAQMTYSCSPWMQPPLAPGFLDVLPFPVENNTGVTIWGKVVDCSLPEVLCRETGWNNPNGCIKEAVYKGDRWTPKQDQQFHTQSRELPQLAKGKHLREVETHNSHLHSQTGRKRNTGGIWGLSEQSTISDSLLSQLGYQEKQQKGWSWGLAPTQEPSPASHMQAAVAGWAPLEAERWSSI